MKKQATEQLGLFVPEPAKPLEHIMPVEVRPVEVRTVEAKPVEATPKPPVTPVTPVTPPVVRLTKPEIWDKLALKTSECTREMENAHAQQRYTTEWADRYFESLCNLQALYVLLVPVDRERVEDFRLKVRKEIVLVEREMSELYEKIAVTRGDKLTSQALTIGLRHFRLVDQYEALSRALAQDLLPKQS